MEKLLSLIKELKTRKIKISNTQKGERIQQTESNSLKHELLETLYADIANEYKFAYMSKDGIMLEIENDSVADGIKNELGSGAITVTLDIKINGLETNAEEENKSYQIECKEKADKKAKAKAKKEEKIARDTADRKAKAKE